MTIIGFGPSSLCRATVQVGDRLIFFVYGDEISGFRVRDFSDVASPSANLISEIAAAAGQTPAVLQSLTEVAATQAMAFTLTAAPTPTPTPTVSCSAESSTVAQHARAADIIVSGVVSATDNGEPKTAVIEVVQYLKGDGPLRVQITGFGSTAQSLTNVFVGQQWIFYATGDSSLVLTALDTAEFDPVVRSDNLVFDEISAVTGQDPLFVQSAESIRAMLALTATASPRATLTQGAALNFFLTLTAQPTPTPIPPTPLLTVESIALTGICAFVALLAGLGVGAFAGFTFKQRD